MATRLKTAMLAAMLTMASLSASAEVTSPTVTHDPLMRRIMSLQLTSPAGGVTGSTRLGSGQTIELSVADPLAPLQPVEGLAPKPAKAKEKAARKVRRADEQLKKMSDEKRAADWVGRR